MVSEAPFPGGRAPGQALGEAHVRASAAQTGVCTAAAGSPGGFRETQTWPVLGPLSQKMPQNQAPRHLLMQGSVVEGCAFVDGLGEVRPEEGSGCHGTARPLRAHDLSTQAQATEVELLRCLCHVPELWLCGQWEASVVTATQTQDTEPQSL